MTTIVKRPADRAMSEVFDALESAWPFGTRHAFHVEDFVEEGGYVLRAELPGLDAESDIEVSRTGELPTITAKREQETHERHRTEFRYGAFSRPGSARLHSPRQPGRFTGHDLDVVGPTIPATRSSLSTSTTSGPGPALRACAPSAGSSGDGTGMSTTTRQGSRFEAGREPGSSTGEIGGLAQPSRHLVVQFVEVVDLQVVRPVRPGRVRDFLEARGRVAVVQRDGQDDVGVRLGEVLPWNPQVREAALASERHLAAGNPHFDVTEPGYG